MDSIDFTQFRTPESRFRTVLRAYSHKPKNRFGDPEYVFMHVGKTGGTSINAFFRDCHNASLRVPIVLNHNWNFKMARLRYPKAKIVVVLRDPLERIISGFNFRLREGRPEGHPWRDSEAIAYGHFNSAEKFLLSLGSDEPYDLSAIRYCFRKINHLRRGYCFHFGDLKNESNLSTSPIHSIGIKDIGKSLPDLIARLNLIETNKLPSIGNIYESSVSSASFIDRKVDENYLMKIRSRIHSEYETYESLKTKDVNMNK